MSEKGREVYRWYVVMGGDKTITTGTLATDLANDLAKGRGLP